MKFTSIATLLSITATTLAAVKDIKLYTKSDNQDANEKGLTFLHEGAGINYAFLTSSKDGRTLSYDDETKKISLPVQVNDGATSLNWPFGIDGDVLQISVTIDNSPDVTIGDDGALTFEGSDSLFAKKNIQEPYQYSQQAYAVVTQDGDGAIPIKLYATLEGGDNSTSTNNSTTSTSSSAVPSAVSSFEAGAAGISAGSFVAVAAAAIGLVF